MLYNLFVPPFLHLQHKDNDIYLVELLRGQLSPMKGPKELSPMPGSHKGSINVSYS